MSAKRDVFARALRLLDTRARRGRAPFERNQLIHAIRSAIDAAIMDAHMSGRVYHAGGEVRQPGEQHEYMMQHAQTAASVEFERAMKEWLS